MWEKIFDDTNKDSLVGYYRSIQDDTDLLNIANKNYLNFIDALENEIKKLNGNKFTGIFFVGQPLYLLERD